METANSGPDPHRSDGSLEGSTSRLWEVRSLPDPANARDWDRVLGCQPIKAALQRYGTLLKLLAERGIDRQEVDLNGLVLLVGPPGVGKSRLASGFADIFARMLDRPTRLLILRTEQVFSQWLGESAKELSKAFQAVRVAAELGPVVLLVDEVEAVAFSRERTINAADPSDLTRFVDRLLQEIDALGRYPCSMVVGTSNFTGVVDTAFLDRADLTLDIPLPDTCTRLAILQDRARVLQPLGLELSREDLATIAREAVGMSGRGLGRLLVQTFMRKEVAFSNMCVGDVLGMLSESETTWEA